MLFYSKHYKFENTVNIVENKSQAISVAYMCKTYKLLRTFLFIKLIKIYTESYMLSTVLITKKFKYFTNILEMFKINLVYNIFYS